MAGGAVSDTRGFSELHGEQRHVRIQTSNVRVSFTLSAESIETLLSAS